ncbi:MAG: ImmA/IrrE family metallo-endopeptidase [Oscillospiraceae bacterium]|nr:ImmA/IrrE family metallo-endopeptidase [Oscillospiraceae bacterium]
MELVQKLIKKYGTNNPFRLCSALGYAVYHVPLTGVRGFFQHYAHKNIVYLSSDLTEQEAAFVCAHEIGHALLHGKVNTLYMATGTFLKTTPYEREADRFAICLLYPDDTELLPYCDCCIDQISAALNLPQQLCQWRCSQVSRWV